MYKCDSVVGGSVEVYAGKYYLPPSSTSPEYRAACKVISQPTSEALFRVTSLA